MAFDFNKQFEKMMREYDVTEVVLLGHMNPDGMQQVPSWGWHIISR